MKDPYRDLRQKERPIHQGDEFSRRHPKMRREQRAKQFSPFDALAGFTEAVEEHQAVTQRPRELSQEEQSALDATLRELNAAFLAYKRGKKGFPELPPVQVRALCFQRDLRQEEIHRDGIRGNLTVIEGTITDLDPLGQSLRIGNTQVAFSDLYGLRVGSEE